MSQIYIGVVHKDNDSAYGVTFPDVAGCFSASDAMKDLHNNACEALALYFEDEQIISPRELDEIKEDDEVKAALSEGAFLIAVPLIKLSGRVQKANITMDAGLLAAVDEVAKQRKLTRSAFLADLARREISNV